MAMRVADFIAQFLRDRGVRAAFLLSGGGMMHLVDAVGRVDGLHLYCCHHEQACAIAAEGYARQKGELGVCYATSGPGATNILTGLVGAWQDSSPVLFLTGQARVSQTIRGTGISGLRQYGTFEVDIISMVQNCTKYAAFLDDPRQARYHLEKAVRLATTGRPGPVLIDVPLDVSAALIDPDTLPGCIEEEPPPPRAHEADIAHVVERLCSAKRPLLLAGHGIRCAGAVAAFNSLVHKLQIPLVATQLAKDLVGYGHPLFVGHPGVRGDRAGNLAVQNADVILTIGCSLHAQTTGYEIKQFAPEAYLIQVDLDGAVLKRAPSRGRKIVSDTAAFLRQLEKAYSYYGHADAHGAWRQRCSTWKTRYPVMREPHRLEEGPVNFYEFADLLSKWLPENATVVTDAGSAYYVMGQAFQLRPGQRYLVSGAMGAMGWALPAALGVTAADPSAMAICVTGDGSLQTNVHELQTLRHHGANVKLFVIDNDGYASIRNTQGSYFAGHYVGASRDSGVSLPSVEKLADTYGLPYVSCPARACLGSALRKMLDTPGPVVCGITAQPDQQILPAVQSMRMPDGRMTSRPLHDMFPFLSEGELYENMCG
jgi:acetolactate synthase-1/2/3 large subunit